MQNENSDPQLVSLSRKKKTRVPKPPWLKVKAPGSPEFIETQKLVKDLKLHTVCEEARCPNIGECWTHHTATFMIMGYLCTRRCNFCSVKKGTDDTLQPLDPLEPYRIGIAVQKLGLKHVVVTSVDRDDLEDFGANHWASTVRSIQKHAPGCKVELLIGDMAGSKERLTTIMDSGVDILNHNIETVPRLYRKVRPYSGYIRSLMILSWAKEMSPKSLTKCGIMVGLGETPDEVIQVMKDLRYHNVDIMTIGQYLRPSDTQMPVKEFITPEQFNKYQEIGLSLGFKFVESGPLVRSSYHAWKHSE
ncbi:MAG: lipoyl synthase [Deltaproteobacteria bacterium]|nr:lipoyl synthase [Deltaproteobacteria bacterium]